MLSLEGLVEGALDPTVGRAATGGGGFRDDDGAVTATGSGGGGRPRGER